MERNVEWTQTYGFGNIPISDTSSSFFGISKLNFDIIQVKLSNASLFELEVVLYVWLFPGQ